MADQTIRAGDPVRLIKKPAGRLSSQYELTVGNIYRCAGIMGNCIVTTTDILDETGSYHPDHVEKMPAGTPVTAYTHPAYK